MLFVVRTRCYGLLLLKTVSDKYANENHNQIITYTIRSKHYYRNAHGDQPDWKSTGFRSVRSARNGSTIRALIIPTNNWPILRIFQDQKLRLARRNTIDLSPRTSATRNPVVSLKSLRKTDVESGASLLSFVGSECPRFTLQIALNVERISKYRRGSNGRPKIPFRSRYGFPAASGLY